MFEKILATSADKGNKILSIHSRNATKDVIELVGCNYPNVAVLHWYSGSVSDLETALANGLYFSVNSAMIASKKGAAIVKRIPVDKMLLESDGPFIKYQGDPFTPSALQKTIDTVAQIKQSDSDTIFSQIWNNTRRIFEGITI